MGCDHDALVQNLRDAGCSEEEIAKFLDCRECGREKAGDALLRAHRDALLEKLHEQKRQIDCLDYLTDVLKKGSEATK